MARDAGLGHDAFTGTPGLGLMALGPDQERGSRRRHVRLHPARRGGGERGAGDDVGDRDARLEDAPAEVDSRPPRPTPTTDDAHLRWDFGVGGTAEDVYGEQAAAFTYAAAGDLHRDGHRLRRQGDGHRDRHRHAGGERRAGHLGRDRDARHRQGAAAGGALGHGDGRRRRRAQLPLGLRQRRPDAGRDDQERDRHLRLAGRVHGDSDRVGRPRRHVEVGDDHGQRELRAGDHRRRGDARDGHRTARRAVLRGGDRCRRRRAQLRVGLRRRQCGAATTQDAAHTYAAAGEYTATLTVSDGEATATETIAVTVAANQAPTVTASADPAGGTAPLTVAFTASGQDAEGDALTYAWSFGDGASAEGASASHTFAAPGTYAVTVTVTDARGATGSATLTVVVEAPSGASGTPPRAALAPVKPASIRALAKRELVAVTCARDGRGTLSAAVAKRVAKRLGLRSRVLASAKVTCAAGRTVSVRLRPGRKVDKALRGGGGRQAAGWRAWRCRAGTRCSARSPSVARSARLQTRRCPSPGAPPGRVVHASAGMRIQSGR